MFWFKILLMVIVGANVIYEIARAGGWEPEPPRASAHSIAAVLFTLLVVGIWVWL